MLLCRLTSFDPVDRIYHSGAIVAGAALAGGLAYAGQKSANKANAKLAKGQGDVDITTTRREDPRVTGHLDAGAQAASDALFGRPSGIAGDPRATATRQPPPAGMRYNKAGKLVKPKNAAAAPTPGGTTAAPAQKSFNGQSQETADLVKRMADLPADNADLYGAGEEYVKGSLGGETTNPLLGKATSAADAIAEDPRLSAYQDFLMGELGIGDGGAGPAKPRPGAGGQGGQGVSYRYSSNASGGMPAPQTPGAQTPGGATATGTDAAIRKLVLGELPPGWQGAEDAITRKVQESRAANIRDLRARAVGSGFYGGDLYRDMEEGAIAQGDMELADSLAAQRYAAFSNALGLGTQYDLGMADVAQRDRATAAGERAAGAASGASARAAADEIASRERLAKMGALGDMLGLGEQGRFGRAGALGDLAGLVSGDQRTALAGVTDIGAGRRGDLGAAGDLSLGSDVARNQFIGNANQLRAAQIAGGNQRAELAFERERFYDPFSRLSAYTDIMGSLYGGLGSETTAGRDMRSTSPPAFTSPIGAGLTGAAIGGQVGAAYKPRNASAGGS